MKVNLRKANALQLELLKKPVPLATTVALNEFSQPIDEVTKARMTAFASESRRTKNIQAAYAIRAAISSANHAAGVDTILNTIACIETELACLNSIVKSPVRPSDSVITGRVEKLSSPESNRYGYSNDITVGVYTELDMAGFNDRIDVLRAEIRQLRDQLLDINIRTTVDLDVRTVETLKAEKLI